jgi:phosphate/phosphite/phosphonate ABC transporter binding protein
MKVEGFFMGEMVVFGYVAAAPSPSATERMAQFSIELGKLASVEIVILEAKSYDDLAACVHRHEVDVAWLPPIPFLALERRSEVVPIVSNQRDGATAYNSVLIVHAGSLDYEPGDLVGKRAAWVDPRSAAGYVLPRIELAEESVDLGAFAAEKFFGSHEAVATAVLERRADFGATYAGFDLEGVLLRGPWMDLPNGEESVRVLAAFGAIPGDCIAARTDIVASVREKIIGALVRISHDKNNRLLLRDVFGIDEFRRWHSGSYDGLREATMHAAERGLLVGEEKKVELFVA